MHGKIVVASALGTVAFVAIFFSLQGSMQEQLGHPTIRSNTMSMRGRAFMPSRRGCDVRAVAEPGTSQSWPQLLDQVGKKETYQMPPADKMALVKQIYVNRDAIKEAFDSAKEGTKDKKEMKMQLKRLKRFLSYGLLDCPEADVIPSDLK
ncbi:hypothetical protein AAMO2058_000075000 [Amorphochlora amoebiformis]